MDRIASLQSCSLQQSAVILRYTTPDDLLAPQLHTKKEMGAGASLLHESDDEEHAQEMATTVMEEMEKLREEGKADAEIKQELVRLIVHKKRHLLQRKVEALQTRVTDDNIEELSREAHKHSQNSQVLTFMVAVDGSKTAEMAFNTMVSRRRRNDNILVYHSFHPKSQENKPHNCKMEAVKTYFETALLSNIPTNHYYLCIDELKRPDDNREKVMFEMIQHLRNRTKDPRIDQQLFGDHTPPDFLVMGYHGRKSEEILERRGIMGSTANHVIRETHIPVILVKRANKGENRTFVMAVDASLRAKRALAQLLLLVRPKDTLKIIHAQELEKPTDTAINTSPNETKAYYEREIEEVCPMNTEYISLVGEGDVTDLIINKVDELDPDYLVLAPAATRVISSVTETLMSKTSSNVILIKADQKSK